MLLPSSQHILHLYRSPSEPYTPESDFHPRATPKPCSHTQAKLVPPGQATTPQSKYSHPRAMLSLPSHAITCSYPQAKLIPKGQDMAPESGFHPRAISVPPSHILTPKPYSQPRVMLSIPSQACTTRPCYDPQVNIFLSSGYTLTLKPTYFTFTPLPIRAIYPQVLFNEVGLFSGKQHLFRYFVRKNHTR